MKFKKSLVPFYEKTYNKFKTILGDDGQNEDQQTTKSLFNLFLFAILAIFVVFSFNLIPLFFSATTSNYGAWGDFLVVFLILF